MPAPIAIDVAEITKRYGAQSVLDAASFIVPQGAMCAMVGVNGAGKTTLLKALLDFHRADSGQIRIFGRDSQQAQARETLTFLPERFIPPPFLSGQEFFGMLARLAGKPVSTADMHEAVGRLDMPPKALDKPVKTYSKGMAQKLGLAAAFSSGRSLLVLDEPMSGLDPKARALVKEELNRLRAAGTTVFFTSHALADVAELCDRMVVLAGGRIRYSGSPSDFLAAWRTDDLERAFLACIAA